MTEQENFLARWTRLKRESIGDTHSTPAEIPRTEPEESLPRAPVGAEPATGTPASLPAIESITGESDIRLFLESGVPTELVRAALRAAWATDPAIRDFVGIAESQWDFNDPSAMPGFAPIATVHDPHSVVTASLSPLDSALAPVERKTDVVNPQRDGQVDKVWLSSAMENRNPVREEVTAQATHPRKDHADSLPRRHGSALPK
jgi:hypothetical protein